MAVVDGVIAATALEHGLTLVTRNVRDFAGLGVVLLNPWDALCESSGRGARAGDAFQGVTDGRV